MLLQSAQRLLHQPEACGGTCKQPSRTVHTQGRNKPCPVGSHKLPRTEELSTSTALPGRACSEQGRCRSARPGALRAPSRRLGGGPGARRPVAQLLTRPLRDGGERRGPRAAPPRCRGADLPLPLPSPRRVPPPPPGPPGTSGPLPHPGPGARQVAAAAEPGLEAGP